MQNEVYRAGYYQACIGFQAPSSRSVALAEVGLRCVLQSVRDILAYMPRYLSPEAVDRWTQFRQRLYQMATFTNGVSFLSVSLYDVLLGPY